MRESWALLLLVGSVVTAAGLTVGTAWHVLEPPGGVPGAMAAETPETPPPEAQPPRALPGLSHPLPVPPGMRLPLPVPPGMSLQPTPSTDEAQAVVDRPAPGDEGGGSAQLAALVNGALAVAAMAALALIQANRRGPLR